MHQNRSARFKTTNRARKNNQVNRMVFALPVLVFVLSSYLIISTSVFGGGTDINSKAGNNGGLIKTSTGSGAKASVPPDGWQLLLVNPKNSLPEGFSVTLKPLKDGNAVDERCYNDLLNMMEDSRAAGLQPLICSSYRTQAKQQQLFDSQVGKLTSQGYSSKAATDLAAQSVAAPGTSEHQTGLAVDIVDAHYPVLDTAQADTATQQWLINNSWKYGFILRYPADKTHITGIQYEPWHYRYVGRAAAKEIHEQGLCLEEYVASK